MLHTEDESMQPSQSTSCDLPVINAFLNKLIKAKMTSLTATRISFCSIDFQLKLFQRHSHFSYSILCGLNANLWSMRRGWFDHCEKRGCILSSLMGEIPSLWTTTRSHQMIACAVQYLWFALCSFLQGIHAISNNSILLSIKANRSVAIHKMLS